MQKYFVFVSHKFALGFGARLVVGALHIASNVTAHATWRNGIELSTPCLSPDAARAQSPRPTRQSPSPRQSLTSIHAIATAPNTKLRHSSSATSLSSSSSSHTSPSSSLSTTPTKTSFVPTSSSPSSKSTTMMPTSTSSTGSYELRVALVYNPLARTEESALSLDLHCIDLSL